MSSSSGRSCPWPRYSCWPQLQAIPDDLYDAAAIDGAGPFGRFWTITLPGIRPMLVVVAIFEALMAITNFDITYSLTQGGPGSATTLLTYFTWAESFKMLDFGRAPRSRS